MVPVRSEGARFSRASERGAMRRRRRLREPQSAAPFFTNENRNGRAMTEKFSRAQMRRIGFLCGADPRTIENYAENRPIRPVAEFAIRRALAELRYSDPRPSTEPKQVTS